MKKKKKAKKNRGSFPQDIIYADLVLRIVSNTEIYVENYKCIISYEENKIILQGKHQQITIEGYGFLIPYYTNECIKITGCVKTIGYC